MILAKKATDEMTAADLVASLSETGMPLIDFDQLKKWIDRQDRLTRQSEETQRDWLCLREDYCRRLAGMLKAMAAVDRRHNTGAEALELIDSLEKLTGEELVACYRRTTARFRDTFPTSFGNGPVTSARSIQKKDLSFYK
jgi:hypothetical protein